METKSSPQAGELTPAQLEKLQGLSASIVASAIELCNVRLPNTGFSDASVRCVYEDLPPTVGYAATIQIRSATPPMEGGRFSYARTDWWDHLLSIPSPRVLLIEDMDAKPGIGAFIGEVYASILRSLGCIAAVTNGAVRDLREVRATGLQVFAGNVSVSHAYAHVFDFGGPVRIAGVKVRPGDVVHGDVNGFQVVPQGIVDEVIAFAEQILAVRESLTGLCRSSDFTVNKLREAVQMAMLPKAKTR